MTSIDSSKTASVSSWREMVRTIAASDFLHKVSETFGTQILLIGVGFATTVAVARTLGPAGRGLYAVMVAIGAIGVQFGNFGLHVSNTYYVAKDRSLLPSLIGNAIGVSLIVGGILAASAGIVFVTWPQLAPVQGAMLVLALAWIPIGLCHLLMRNLLLGVMEVRWYNTVEILNRVAAALILAALIFSRSLTVVAAFAAMTTGFVLSLGSSIWRLQRFAKRFPFPSLRTFRNNLGVGLRGYVVCLLSFLVLRIDLLMVKYMLGAEQAGYYSIAATLADYVLLLPAVVGSILFPKLSALADTSDKFRFAKNVTLCTACVLLPIVAIAGGMAKIAIHVVFGKAFDPAAMAFVCLLPGVFLLGVQTVAVQFLNSFGYPKIVIAAWAVTTMLNIGLNFWAIPAHGIIGASLVSSFTYSVVCLMVMAIIYRMKKGHETTRTYVSAQAL